MNKQYHILQGHKCSQVASLIPWINFGIWVTKINSRKIKKSFIWLIEFILSFNQKKFKMDYEKKNLI